MKCPFCGHSKNKVIDSREVRGSETIRRRRDCGGCGKRFTTYEKVEYILPVVEKKDGRREAFSRDKIFAGIKKACEKRSISVDLIDTVVTEVEKELHGLGVKEISSSDIGSKIMEKLALLDKVAYVRFASVYREFKDVNEFFDELKNLLKNDSSRSKRVKG